MVSEVNNREIRLETFVEVVETLLLHPVIKNLPLDDPPLETEPLLETEPIPELGTTLDLGITLDHEHQKQIFLE